MQPGHVTVSTSDQQVFATEGDFQAHLAACEDNANVDLLVDECRQGSAVDKEAPDYDPTAPATWRPLAVPPRGDSILCYRTYVCHCHGASRAKLPDTEGLSSQATFVAKFTAAHEKGR